MSEKGTGADCWSAHSETGLEPRNCGRSYVFMLVKDEVIVVMFWVKSPRGLAGRGQRFGEECCLLLQG